jgi:hypothetical protein
MKKTGANKGFSKIRVDGNTIGSFSLLNFSPGWSVSRETDE